jgi:hypothetical protein
VPSSCIMHAVHRVAVPRSGVHICLCIG